MQRAAAVAAALFCACAAASAAPVPAAPARTDLDPNAASGKLVVLLPIDIVRRAQFRLGTDAEDGKIFYNSLGDFIQSSSFFPIEINVPDVVRWFYGFMSSWFPSLANRWQEGSTPRIRLFLLAPPPVSNETHSQKTAATNIYKKLFIAPMNNVVVVKSSTDGRLQLTPLTVYCQEIIQRLVLLAEIDLSSGSDSRQSLQEQLI